MTERTGTSGRIGTTGWSTVARHDFGGPAELDATIVAVLSENGAPGEPPLYESVDAELAEQFLTSADGDDASVVFSVAGQAVRVSADGTVELRGRPGDAVC
ncbi:HalOD1 output domain-containing protein [Halobellus sp. GM3]|uniref:HalOD1 output domain-containing protein n=1 Tax=Halobellus sp. GM3 TaxID=3458410 RepID=UPI00403E2CAA